MDVSALLTSSRYGSQIKDHSESGRVISCAPPAARRTRTFRQENLAVLDLDALERIVEQAVEFTEFAGIIDARKRTGEVQRLRRRRGFLKRRAHRARVGFIP